MLGSFLYVVIRLIHGEMTKTSLVSCLSCSLVFLFWAQVVGELFYVPIWSMNRCKILGRETWWQISRGTGKMLSFIFFSWLFVLELPLLIFINSRFFMCFRWFQSTLCGWKVSDESETRKMFSTSQFRTQLNITLASGFGLLLSSRGKGWWGDSNCNCFHCTIMAMEMWMLMASVYLSI